jgi:hypothetical protein
VVLCDPCMAAGVILPHVRAHGGGQHVAPRAHQEREEKRTDTRKALAHQAERLCYLTILTGCLLYNRSTRSGPKHTKK